MTGKTTVLAFDIGLRRTGVAVGDQMTQTARPLTTLTPGYPVDDAQIDKILADWQPAVVVVGLPPTREGGENRIAKAARRFAGSIVKRHAIPCEFVDETLTSIEAEARLREQRRDGKRGSRIRKNEIDAVAAAVILETWLATQTTS